MVPVERTGLLLCRSPELARDHALAATAYLLHNRHSPSRTGLIVEVSIEPSRLIDRADLEPWQEVDGHEWVQGAISPDEVRSLDTFDASEDLANPHRVADLASVFDDQSPDWRRASLGEMEA